MVILGPFWVGGSFLTHFLSLGDFGHILVCGSIFGPGSLGSIPGLGFILGLMVYFGPFWV